MPRDVLLKTCFEEQIYGFHYFTDKGCHNYHVIRLLNNCHMF